MNNLIIDIGNTKLKWGVFKNTNLISCGSFLNEEGNDVILDLSSVSSGCQFCIVSNSGSSNPWLINELSKKLKVIILSSKLDFPFSILYETPETLGLDRLANAAAAYALFPKKNCLIIDAGTCITYDLITTEGTYLGGVISPGLKMRFQAMHTFTAKLPLVHQIQHLKSNSFIGKTTLESIQIGAVEGLAHEIDGFIQNYSTDYKDLTIIFTGGDAVYLSTRLKSSIFVDLNFQLKGLNTLLEHLKAND